MKKSTKTYLMLAAAAAAAYYLWQQSQAANAGTAPAATQPTQ